MSSILITDWEQKFPFVFQILFFSRFKKTISKVDKSMDVMIFRKNALSGVEGEGRQ